MTAPNSRNLSSAYACAERYNIPAYESYHDMLLKEQIDVVDILTPSGMHPTHAMDVMQRYGVHAVIEKPMALALATEEAKRIAADLKKNGKVHHAFLGITGVSISSSIANKLNLPADKGVLVQAVGGGVLVPVGTAAAAHLFGGSARPRALGVVGVWAARDRAAARAVPNIKVVKRFIVFFLLGRFLCPQYMRRGPRLTGS